MMNHFNVQIAMIGFSALVMVVSAICAACVMCNRNTETRRIEEARIQYDHALLEKGDV